MSLFKWYRRRRMRYYKAMMLYWQDEYLHANDDDEYTKQKLYFKYKTKYQRLESKIRNT